MHRFLASLAVLTALIMSIPSASAQGGYEIKGTILDQDGLPVIGATILEQGTNTGTSADMDGKYVLRVSSPDATVEISCIGYTTATYAAHAVPATIVLEEHNVLDDAVVIGYGTLSKKELSSSIVQVNKEDFFKGSMNNVMEMLVGKVAGLNVTNSASANPNSLSSLQIRGATSISASNDPLIVIDGVPGGSIRNIAPQDIESMTVLKDAASSAIYGTQGANGVILITTRKGSEGEVGTSNITYDGYFGVNFAKPHADILSADEFRRSMRGTDYGYDTDWYDLLLRDFSFETNQYVSIDGSTKKGSYNASINWKRATGLDLVDAREEFGGRLSVQQKAIKDKLQLGFTINVRRINEDWGNDSMFDTALSMNPTMPVYNEDGTWYQPTNSTGALNPVQELTVNESNGQRLYLTGTVDAKWNIYNDDKNNLSTSVRYTYDFNDLKSNYYTPSDSGESYWGGYDGSATVSYTKYWTNQVEWLLNYSLYLGDHSFQFVGGYSYEEDYYETLGATNYDFTFDNMSYNNIGAGSYLSDGKASMYTGKSLSKLIGVFARLNYNWKNLIMASASLRYEGSTKFGANNKWGYFPAASVAWEIAEMPFMRGYRDTFESIKPRVSFGVTGRSDFDAYQSLYTYSTSGTYYIDGSWVVGYAPSGNANPDLGWEKLVSVNAGIDFSLFGGRLSGSLDWFHRESQDLLYNYTAPQPPYVYSSILVNVGTTTNEGVELSLSGQVLKKKDFSWDMTANWSTGNTKLTKLSSDVYQASYIELYQKSGVGTSEYYFRVQEGSKIGQFYGYEYAGVDEDGNLLVYTADGDTVVASSAAEEDKRYIGNGVPKHFVSWSNTFRYKNFDLNILFSGAFGHDIYNERKYNMGLQGSGGDNVLRSAYLDDYDVYSSGGVISSFFLEKGDYFKLENVTLGWNFYPKNTAILQSLRVYVSAKNLYTFTGYSGNDPSIVTVNGLTPGVDSSSAYPLATQVTLGVTARF